MLISTYGRGSVALPLNTITRAESAEGGWIVIDAQGEQHRVSSIDWEIAVEGTPTATLPAQPGTYLIGLCHEEDNTHSVFRTNVLGWMVCADTAIRPVMLDPEALIGGDWQILHPDGRVEQPNGTSWDNLEDWKASAERKASEQG